MKTTLDLSDALFFDVKQAALAHRTSMRAMVEAGLRHVLSELKTAPKPTFKLRNASVASGLVLQNGREALESVNDEMIERHLRVDQAMRQRIASRKS